MQLNEVIKEVGMTKRAVKYYEEKGLLSIKKDKNGYRDYTIEDVEALKKDFHISKARDQCERYQKTVRGK